MNGPTGKTEDFVIGEEIIGQTSGAIGLFIEKTQFRFCKHCISERLRFEIGESILTETTGITATVNDTFAGDSNILDRFTLDAGQRDTILDYSRLIRKPNTKDPRRKLRVVFESAEYTDTTEGDITTISSYDQFDYCDLPVLKNDLRVTDILDIRPRVRQFDSNSNSVSF